VSKSRAEVQPPVLPAAHDLPWHLAVRERLAAAVRAGRLSHGLLLAGPAGVGKQAFAARLAAALVCARRPDGLEPCGSCPECSLSFAGTHPDLYWVRPLEEKKTIQVDPVREVCAQLAMTSMRSGRRVAVISPADAMTINAQNALLKTLEEPGAGTVLLLVTARPSRVLATLRSRCQRVELARPPAALAAGWLAGEVGEGADPRRLLEMAAGAPLRARELAPHAAGMDAQMGELVEALARGRAPLSVLAEPLVGEGLPARLDWLEHWLGQLARERLAGATKVTNPAGSAMHGTAQTVNMAFALRLVDRIREVRRLLDGSAQPQLAVEALLFDFAAVFRGRGER
jgi:DNA polymerase-3 subunit delta'